MSYQFSDELYKELLSIITFKNEILYESIHTALQNLNIKDKIKYLD